MWNPWLGQPSNQQLDPTSRGRHGSAVRSSQSLAWASLPRLPGRWSRSGSIGVLQVLGSTAMNPGRRQPCPLAMMGQKRAGLAFSRNAACMGLLLIWPLAMQPALLAMALDAAAKGLDRSAVNLLSLILPDMRLHMAARSSSRRVLD
jgi:hypothetical protein